MSAQLSIFDQSTRGMVRSTDPATSRDAAHAAVSTNESNRRLILRLLVEHDWMTQFCPFVLMPLIWDDEIQKYVKDPRYKQTAIGPRYAQLCRSGLIEKIEKRCPRRFAESHRPVLAYRITPAGRLYLEKCAGAEAGCGYLTGPQRGDA